ncbi:MAG: winged helix-turn-helix transcriptional regulator [Halobacteriaceae archaeon]
MAEDGVDEAKRATLRRFAALGTIPFAAGGAAASEAADAPLSREAIAGYIAETPGAHFSKLRDDLHLGTGEAQHHLRSLLEEDTVESVRDGDYRRFYPAGRFSQFEQVALGYLRRETARGMVLALLRDPGRSGTQLATDLGVSRATVSDWATRLETAGLLSREDGYAVERPETVLVLVVQYGDSMGEDAARFAATASELLSFDP